MLHGIGIDLIEMDRIEKAINRHPGFIERVFTSDEQDYCSGKPRSSAHFAGRFAAKEAVAKALGTGLRGFKWVEIEVIRDGAGRPTVRLYGNALKKANELKVTEIAVSLSLGRETAVASAVVVREE